MAGFVSIDRQLDPWLCANDFPVGMDVERVQPARRSSGCRRQLRRRGAAGGPGTILVETGKTIGSASQDLVAGLVSDWLGTIHSCARLCRAAAEALGHWTLRWDLWPYGFGVGTCYSAAKLFSILSVCFRSAPRNSGPANN